MWVINTPTVSPGRWICPIIGSRRTKAKLNTSLEARKKLFRKISSLKAESSKKHHLISNKQPQILFWCFFATFDPPGLSAVPFTWLSFRLDNLFFHYWNSSDLQLPQSFYQAAGHGPERNTEQLNPAPLPRCRSALPRLHLAVMREVFLLQEEGLCLPLSCCYSLAVDALRSLRGLQITLSLSCGSGVALCLWPPVMKLLLK